MNITQNIFALVWAFNPSIPPAESKKQLRQMERSFLESVSPLMDIVSEIFKGVKTTNPFNLQCRREAMLSILYDCGIDVFLQSGVTGLILSGASRREIAHAICDIPAMGNTIRPSLLPQLEKYSIMPLDRRHFEAELYNGNIFFTISLQLDEEGRRVYAPAVISPFYRFLYACSKR